MIMNSKRTSEKQTQRIVQPAPETKAQFNNVLKKESKGTKTALSISRFSKMYLTFFLQVFNYERKSKDLFPATFLSFFIYLFKLTESGEVGASGAHVLRRVNRERNRGNANATHRLRSMEEKIARGNRTKKTLAIKTSRAQVRKNKQDNLRCSCPCPCVYVI